jgi:hypothetical protein
MAYESTAPPLSYLAKRPNILHEVWQIVNAFIRCVNQT